MSNRRYNKNEVIVVEQKLLKHRAWWEFGGAAQAVYMIFLTKRVMVDLPGKPGKRRRRVIANNGEIGFTYEEARKEYGIAYKRFKAALKQLVANGFVDVAATGMGTHKVATWYAISERWRQFGKEDFVVVEMPKRKAGHVGFKPGNQLWKKKSTVTNDRGTTVKNDRGEGKTADAPLSKRTGPTKAEFSVRRETINV